MFWTKKYKLLNNYTSDEIKFINGSIKKFKYINKLSSSLKNL